MVLVEDAARLGDVERVLRTRGTTAIRSSSRGRFVTTPCSAAAAGICSRRSSSRCACFSASSGRFASAMRSRRRSTSSPLRPRPRRAPAGSLRAAGAACSRAGSSRCRSGPSRESPSRRGTRRARAERSRAPVAAASGTSSSSSSDCLPTTSNSRFEPARSASSRGVVEPTGEQLQSSSESRELSATSDANSCATLRVSASWSPRNRDLPHRRGARHFRSGRGPSAVNSVDARPRHALDQQPVRVVGELQHLRDAHDGADRVDVVRPRALRRPAPANRGADQHAMRRE